MTCHQVIKNILKFKVIVEDNIYTLLDGLREYEHHFYSSPNQMRIGRLLSEPSNEERLFLIKIFFRLRENLFLI